MKEETEQQKYFREARYSNCMKLCSTKFTDCKSYISEKVCRFRLNDCRIILLRTKQRGTQKKLV
jgi:hypothetical protein